MNSLKDIFDNTQGESIKDVIIRLCEEEKFIVLTDLILHEERLNLLMSRETTYETNLLD